MLGILGPKFFFRNKGNFLALRPPERTTKMFSSKKEMIVWAINKDPKQNYDIPSYTNGSTCFLIVCESDERSIAGPWIYVLGNQGLKRMNHLFGCSMRLKVLRSNVMGYWFR